ncbi:solute carrier family 39 (zinc transporter), member 9 [Paragonimus westermani]|uniref:Solute carrier family 39 (Zinc transporter), member 9 n=1 Tax=Paragonimus westermani TaxID=34504 RepID=A0A5J4NU82_9TREM|nr:solute carrier family 39 (zinc transporter), member 9 [Paragonimus westermani]
MLTFIFLNLLLFVGSYLAGYLPIAFNLSPIMQLIVYKSLRHFESTVEQSIFVLQYFVCPKYRNSENGLSCTDGLRRRIPEAKLRLLTIFGAGLLLGAALVIIIPEGIDCLYSVQQKSSLEKMRPLENHVGVNALHQVKRAAVLGDIPGKNAPSIDLPHSKNGNSEQHLHTPSAVSDPLLPFSFLSVHQHIGVGLLSGYLFMLLVDQLGRPLLSMSCSTRTLNRLSRCCSGQNSTSTSSSSTVVPNAGVCGRRRSTATLGLVFHSFADGLALGAAFAVDQIQLELILFIAIILHKVPAAFGLCCYLIHEGFPHDRIRVHLLIFAAASPLAALMTYSYLVWPSTSMVGYIFLVCITFKIVCMIYRVACLV